MVSKFYTVAMLAIYVATVFTSCIKGKNCTNHGYGFQMAAKIYPDYDSIQIGDTIFVELKEPINLNDLNTGNIVNFTGAENLGTGIAFDELLGNAVRKSAANDFTLILLKGSEVVNADPNLLRQYRFKEENGFYVFKLAVIPKKTGIYRTGVSDAVNVNTVENKCEKAGFSITLKETNQHLYYNQWNFGVTPNLPNGVYCFKVK